MKINKHQAFVAAFVATICIPSFFMMFGSANANTENRVLSKPPELLTEDGVNLDFPSEFDDYFADNFAFRAEMVTMSNLATTAVLSDTLNENVVVGKGGTLFFDETLPAFMRTDVLSETELGRLVRTLYLQQEYANSYGADFIFTAAPNKNTIYPELMPDRFTQPDAESNAALLYDLLDKSGIGYIDMAEVLKAQKGGGMLYHYEDTHWNSYGALVAYRAIMEKIAGKGEYEYYDDEEKQAVYDFGGDLHNFLFPSAKGNNLDYDLGIDVNYIAARPVNIERDVETKTSSGRNGHNVLMYRDSFGRALFPLLSSNIGSITYTAAFPYNYSYVEEERPDTVLVEIAERNISQLLAQAPVMPAPHRKLDSTCAGTLAAEAGLVKEGKNLKLSGIFDPSNYDPANDAVLVGLEGKDDFLLEAFPIIDEAWREQADNGNCGFTLTLPGDIPAGEYDVSVILCKGDVHYASGTVLNVQFHLPGK